MTITHPQPPLQSALSWTKEIESLLSARADPRHPDFGETQRLIELVFGFDSLDHPRGGARLTPEEQDAAIAYYLDLSRRAAARDR